MLKSFSKACLIIPIFQLSCNDINDDLKVINVNEIESADSIVYQSTNYKQNRFVFNYEEHKDGVNFCELLNMSSDTSFINQMGEFKLSDIGYKLPITDSISLSILINLIG
jgi:hypothetical protein